MNTAYIGGAIANFANVSGYTTISSNKGTQGGGLYNDGIVNMSSTTFQKNSAAAWGGGIMSNGVLNLYRCNVSANSATNYGGGIYVTGSGILGSLSIVFISVFTAV